MLKKEFYKFLLVIAVLLVGLNLINTNDNSPNKIDQVLHEIHQNYVDSVDMNSLVESTIHQTLTNLDPHSVYMDNEEVNYSMAQMEGSFEGIGVEFSIHRDTIIIINVIPRGPSEKRGLKAGDRIIFIDDELVAGIGITNQDVIKKLRGKRGTLVTVGIKNKKEQTIRLVNLRRDKIPISSLDVAYEISPNIGYIKLNRFSATTYKEFKQELELLLNEKKIENLILDLRGNTGGYLDQAIKILNEFFTKGELLVYTKGQARKEKKYFSNSFGMFGEGKLCVLMDEGSASASEIVAGAIQDHDRGLIIGRRSFGKGLVQEQIPFQDGSLIRLTVSRYYTPSGRCIQKPYSGDQQAYFSEMYLRIPEQKTDSLEKFTTANGKTVYGGGGITPDYVIESVNDSLPINLVYLYTSDFFDNLAFDYVDKNRAQMLNVDFKDFTISNIEQQRILQQIKGWMDLEQKVSKNLDIELTQHKSQIIQRLHTLIIRQYWGWAEMQIFLNQNDKFISSSLSLLKT